MSHAILFENVSKEYPLYSGLTSGLKNLLVGFPHSLKNFSKAKFTALENINFRIEPGETTAIIGRNGAGKSTTLGLIAGVLRPNSGKVSVTQRVSPLLELGGGFHPDLTGRENIRLNGVLMGLSRRQVIDKTEEIADFAELSGFIDQPLRTFSTGMVARLGFAVVSTLDPELLLIDEVFAVGDLRFAKKCHERIAEFKKKGSTIVLVSHAISDVEQLCERSIWIDQHRIREDGPTAEVLPKYRAHFEAAP